MSMPLSPLMLGPVLLAAACGICASSTPFEQDISIGFLDDAAALLQTYVRPTLQDPHLAELIRAASQQNRGAAAHARLVVPASDAEEEFATDAGQTNHSSTEPSSTSEQGRTALTAAEREVNLARKQLEEAKKSKTEVTKRVKEIEASLVSIRLLADSATSNYSAMQNQEALDQQEASERSNGLTKQLKKANDELEDLYHKQQDAKQALEDAKKVAAEHEQRRHNRHKDRDIKEVEVRTAEVKKISFAVSTGQQKVAEIQNAQQALDDGAKKNKFMKRIRRDRKSALLRAVRMLKSRTLLAARSRAYLAQIESGISAAEKSLVQKELAAARIEAANKSIPVEATGWYAEAFKLGFRNATLLHQDKMLNETPKNRNASVRRQGLA